jgi:hypothetical protein
VRYLRRFTPAVPTDPLRTPHVDLQGHEHAGRSSAGTGPEVLRAHDRRLLDATAGTKLHAIPVISAGVYESIALAAAKAWLGSVLREDAPRIWLRVGAYS